MRPGTATPTAPSPDREASRSPSWRTTYKLCRSCSRGSSLDRFDGSLFNFRESDELVRGPVDRLSPAVSGRTAARPGEQWRPSGPLGRIEAMTSSRPAPHGGGSRASSPGLAVAAVARRLGVAPATLRTWDRRYGL